MARRHTREWTWEEYDNWSAATKTFETVAEAADEEGGPSLSLVPRTERNEVWPTDLLPPITPDPDAEPVEAMPVERHSMICAIDATVRFYHGSRAGLSPGDLLTPGNASNYADRKLSWIYFSGTLDAAICGCELAKGEGREHRKPSPLQGRGLGEGNEPSAPVPLSTSASEQARKPAYLFPKGERAFPSNLRSS